MPFIYITGVAGSGKSTVQKELKKRGIESYDEDDPGVGAAHNKITNQPVKVPSADKRTPEWFERHEWRVFPQVLDKLRRLGNKQMVILFGISIDKKVAEAKVDEILYLKVSEGAIRKRLAGRDKRENDYGKNENELQGVLSRKRTMDQRFGSTAIIIDADRPVEEVVRDVLHHIKSLSSKSIR